MATAIIMPRQGQSVESCIITKWHKKEGDEVKLGEILFTYETDKSTFDEEAKAEGILLKILHGEDDDVPCLENVCVIGAAGEDISAFSSASAEQKAVSSPASVPETVSEKKEVATALSVETAPVRAEGFVPISPRARHLAEKLDIDYRLAKPTGAEGRIIERDIDTLAKAGAPVPAAETPAAPQPAAAEVPAAEYIDEKLSNMRKVIARSMHHSLSTMAQLTHTASFDATEIMEFRKKLKPKIEKGEVNNITLNDIVMWTVARILLRHKSLNANLLENDTMRYFKHVNLGMAVDTPRGLMVPTLFAADTMNLNETAGRLKALAAECQKGTISPDKLTGGSFTVSNLGVFGIEHFTPVINPPQTGILGVNTIQTRVREVGGVLKTYPCMTLSLTYDHRALDGAPASRFLAELCRALENFSISLATL